jgi:hypothetical protein
LPQEDYLKRQIDQFAKALAKLLLKLNGLKNTSSTSEERDLIVNEVFEKEAQLSVDGLLGIPANNFVTTLLQVNKLNAEQLESLGNVLYALSEGHRMERELLTRTQAILEYMHSRSDTYSLERHFQIEQIKKKIHSLDN